MTGMADHRALEEQVVQLEELEEERFLAKFHEQVQKQRKKAWHDCHIKVRTFKENDLVLLYASKFEKFPCKHLIQLFADLHLVFWIQPVRSLLNCLRIQPQGYLHHSQVTEDPF